MKFDDFKNKFSIYNYVFNNDVYCIFDTSAFSQKQIIDLCAKAREEVNAGFIFQTSGSSGNPKFVLHSYESLKLSCMNVNSWVKTTSKDRFFSPISIYHMGGFSVLARSIFAEAEPAKFMSKWDQNEFLKLVEELSISVVSMVPSQVFSLVQSQVQAPKSLRVIFVGGSELSDELYFKARQLGWPLLRTFGSSEACSQIFTEVYEDKKSIVTNFKKDLFLLPHWQTKIDEEKRLMIKGNSLCRGYLFLKREDIKFALLPMDDHGFFVTEDRVVLKEKKLIEFLGRINDFIKINSTLVQINTLRSKFSEFCQNKISEFNQIILIELPDLKSGHILAAVTTPKVIGFESLIHAWNKQVSSAEKIRGVYVVKELPKSELGKVKYSEIKMLLISKSIFNSSGL